MRKGKNPYKVFGEGKAYIKKPIIVSMLTFIPNFSAYYKDRFKILKLSLESLIKTTDKNIADILVFDNGSCDTVTKYLQNLLNKKDINFLILSSENLGYNAALNEIYNFCDGTYLSYSDDDVYFHDGWLESAIDIHKGFPSLGFVSCSPTKATFDDSHYYTEKLVKIYPKIIDEVKNHNLWKTDWDKLFLNSIGNIQLLPSLNDINVPLFTNKDGITAFPVSTHFHYVLNRKAINLLYPYPVGDLMSSNSKNPDFNMTIQLNKRLEDAKLARLSTTKLYSEHLGNVWTNRADYLQNNLDKKKSIPFKKVKNEFSLTQRILFKFMNIPFLGRIPHFLYDWSFNLIGEKTNYDRQKMNK